jgi:hypothetical protein
MRIFVDGVERFASNGITNSNNPGTLANIDVSGASKITLLVGSNGRNWSDHAMWADPKFEYSSDSEQVIVFTSGSSI